MKAYAKMNGKPIELIKRDGEYFWKTVYEPYTKHLLSALYNRGFILKELPARNIHHNYVANGIYAYKVFPEDMELATFIKDET